MQGSREPGLLETPNFTQFFSFPLKIDSHKLQIKDLCFILTPSIPKFHSVVKEVTDRVFSKLSSSQELLTVLFLLHLM